MPFVTFESTSPGRRDGPVVEGFDAKLCVIDATTFECLLASRPLVEFLGIEGHEGWSPVDNWISAEDREALRAAIRKTSASGVDSKLQVSVVGRDGRLAPLAAELHRLPDGKHDRVVAILVDVADADDRVAPSGGELPDERLGLVLWSGTPDLRRTHVSANVESLFGHPRSRWTEEPSFWIAHVHPDDRERVVRRCREKIARGESHELDYRFLDADGATHAVRDVVEIVSEEGRPLRLLGTMFEPSRLNPLAAADAGSERRYRDLYDKTPVMMHSIDPGGRLLSVSNRWLEVLGYEREEVIGRPSTDFLTPESRRFARQIVLPTYFVLGRCKDVPYRMVKKSGEVIDVLLSAIAERDPDGTVRRSLAVIIDVTERRRIEAERNRLLLQERAAREAAERSKSLLDTLFATAPVGLGLLDADLRFVRVNERLAAIHGTRADEDVGRTLAEVIPSLAPQIEPAVRSVLRSGCATVGVEVSGEAPGHPGEVRHWEGCFFPVDGATGARIGVGLVVMEVTERKRASELQDALYRSTVESLRIRDDFLAVASHELKTPLTPLGIALQMLERKLEAGEPVEPSLVRLGMRQVRKLTALINDLLDVSAIQQGRLDLVLQSVGLRELVRSIVATYAGVSPAHPIELVEPEEELRMVGDARRLAQVLSNLVENAIQYSPDGGPVRVELARHGDEAVISVSDRGIGISKEQHARLFNRFFRADNAPITSFQGLGLGLYIARDITERHGGRITVESRVGAGSTFRVFLPLVQGNA